MLIRITYFVELSRPFKGRTLTATRMFELCISAAALEAPSDKALLRTVLLLP